MRFAEMLPPCGAHLEAVRLRGEGWRCGISTWGCRHTWGAPCTLQSLPTLNGDKDPPTPPPRAMGVGADPPDPVRPAIFNLVLSPQAAGRRGEAADPRAMVQSRRTWNLGAPPSLRGLWRVGRAPEEPERGMARPAPASPAARPFPHTGPGRLRTGESAFLKCLLISLPSSSRHPG